MTVMPSARASSSRSSPWSCVMPWPRVAGELPTPPIPPAPKMNSLISMDVRPRLTTRTTILLLTELRVAVVAPGRRRRREVDGRVPVEEAERLQREPGVLHRHDREVLRPAEVGHADRVPHHDVGVDDRPVGRGPPGQPVAARVLVREVAGRPPLVGR